MPKQKIKNKNKGRFKPNRNRKEKKQRKRHKQIENEAISTAFIIYSDNKVIAVFDRPDSAISHAESVNKFDQYVSVWELIYTKSFHRIWYNDGNTIDFDQQFGAFCKNK